MNKQATLTALNNKALTLQIAEFNAPIIVMFSEQHPAQSNTAYISVLSKQAEEFAADCEVSTSLQTLVKLKQAEQSITELIRQDQLDVIGDLKVAQNFAQFMETLEIDWQTELAEQIGDIATHKLVQLSQNIARKVSFFKEQVQADSSEWLVYEKKLVVTGPEIRQHNTNVDNVVAQLSSIENRIVQLTNCIQSKQPSSTTNQ